MTRDEELTQLRQRLAKSVGMEGYADRRKAIEQRIKELEDAAIQDGADGSADRGV